MDTAAAVGRNMQTAFESGKCARTLMAPFLSGLNTNAEALLPSVRKDREHSVFDGRISAKPCRSIAMMSQKLTAAFRHVLQKGRGLFDIACHLRGPVSEWGKDGSMRSAYPLGR